MAVMAREAWTDERLDDLNARVESVDRRMGAGFAEVREELRAVRAEMATQFAVQNRMLVLCFLGVIATVIAQT